MANLVVVLSAISHPNAELRSMETTPDPDLQIYNIFITTIIENKPVNMTVVVVEEKEMVLDFAFTITKLIRHAKFPLYRYHLDSLSPLTIRKNSGCY